MSQTNRQIGKKLSKWQKTAKPPMRHVAKPGEAGRSVVTITIFIFRFILCIRKIMENTLAKLAISMGKPFNIWSCMRVLYPYAHLYVETPI